MDFAALIWAMLVAAFFSAGTSYLTIRFVQWRTHKVVKDAIAQHDPIVDAKLFQAIFAERSRGPASLEPKPEPAPAPLPMPPREPLYLRKRRGKVQRLARVAYGPAPRLLTPVEMEEINRQRKLAGLHRMNRDGFQRALDRAPEESRADTDALLHYLLVYELLAGDHPHHQDSVSGGSIPLDPGGAYGGAGASGGWEDPVSGPEVPSSPAPAAASPDPYAAIGASIYSAPASEPAQAAPYSAPEPAAASYSAPDTGSISCDTSSVSVDCSSN